MTNSLKVMLGAGALALGGCEMAGADGAGTQLDQSALEGTLNPSGVAETLHTSGAIDRTNGFFQPIGTNARTCETCHAASNGWTITAASAAIQFFKTDGLAPLFMLQDTGARPDSDISTLDARRKTFQTTVDRALIRFTRNLAPIAANPASEFTVTAVSDPSGFSTLSQTLAFRRPSPTANESKVSSTGWNGGGTTDVPSAVLATTGGAARLHLQRVDALPTDLAISIRDFQLGVIFAQKTDFRAGRLDSDGAHGGAAALMAQPFTVGVNDIQSATFTSKIFDLYDAWARYDRGGHDSGHGDDGSQNSARASIYRGQQIFNTRTFAISNTHGVNDVLGQATVQGTCGTCHNTPNVGGHSVFRVFDIGSADAPRCDAAFPLITIQNKATSQLRTVCDLARGTNGVWADVGSFRAPPLRGLAARAPYFHDGQARTVRDVVDYHNAHFNIGLSSRDREDLTAFLSAL